jgi:hypothetical protein
MSESKLYDEVMINMSIFNEDSSLDNKVAYFNALHNYIEKSKNKNVIKHMRKLLQELLG